VNTIQNITSFLICIRFLTATKLTIERLPTRLAVCSFEPPYTTYTHNQSIYEAQTATAQLRWCHNTGDPGSTSADSRFTGRFRNRNNHNSSKSSILQAGTYKPSNGSGKPAICWTQLRSSVFTPHMLLIRSWSDNKYWLLLSSTCNVLNWTAFGQLTAYQLTL